MVAAVRRVPVRVADGVGVEVESQLEAQLEMELESELDKEWGEQRQLNWPAAVHIKSKYSRDSVSLLYCHIASARRRSVNVGNYS